MGEPVVNPTGTAAVKGVGHLFADYVVDELRLFEIGFEGRCLPNDLVGGGFKLGGIFGSCRACRKFVKNGNVYCAATCYCDV